MNTIILNTRSETTKMSPIALIGETPGEDCFTLHIGRHSSYVTDRAFLKDFKPLRSEYSRDIDSGIHTEQINEIMTGIEKVLLEKKPRVVLVHGDTNAVLTGALAVLELHIKIAHGEAGFLILDQRMMEKGNRIIADRIPDVPFSPTKTAEENPLDEGIPGEKIFVTENTIAGAMEQDLAITQKKGTFLQKLSSTARCSFFITAHRAENIDDRQRLKEIPHGSGHGSE